MAYTRPASAVQSGFARPPSSGNAQAHTQRLAAAAQRSRTAACLALPAAALILYLAAFGLPWRSSRSATDLTVLDGPDLSSGSGDASGQSAAAQRTASTDAAGTADAAAALAQQPGSEKLWAAAHIPDISKPGRGRKQNLLRGDGKALCAAIAPEHAKAVALVGNGPLTDESRGDITAADAIIRFNEMNNRLPGERLDVWFARHNYRQPAPYWGFWQLRNGSGAEPLIDQAHAVLLLGGNETSAEPLLVAYPTLEPKLFQADTRQYQQLYQDIFGNIRMAGPYRPDPSTGLLGLLQVLACVKAAGKAAPHVDVYGFNWSGKHWMTHQMRAEETIARNLAAPFGLTFHETACSGLRSCEAACDVAEFQAADPDFAAEACRKRAATGTSKEPHDAAADAEEHVNDKVQEVHDMMPP